MPSSPHFSQAEELYHQGLDYLAEGNSAAAVQTLRRCLEVEPAMLDAMHGLIRALQEQGDLDGALAVAQRLLQLDPEEPLVHTSLSILYQHKGMITEAEAAGVRAKLLGWKKQLQPSKPQP